MMSKPTILFVPGFWEGPTVFEAVAAKLRQSGYQTQMAKLVSTGTKSPGNPTMKDDVASIRPTIETSVQKGEDVVLVLHSAAGLLGSEAMEGLDKSARKAAGHPGGVVKIIFLTAGVGPEGYTHGDLPFVEERDGAWYCKDARNALFADVPEAEVDHWMAAMQPQPSQGWNGTISYCGWKVVPSVYVIARQDALLPVPLQEQFAQLAGSQVVETIDAGHMLQLSKPSEVAQLIEKHAASN